MLKKQIILGLVFLLVVSLVSAIEPTINYTYPESNEITRIEPFDQIFYVNWSDAEEMYVSWFINESLVKYETTKKTHSFYNFDTNFTSEGCYNIGVNISNGINQTSYNWLLNITNGVADIYVDSINITQNNDLLYPSWKFINSSNMDYSEYKLYVNGVQVFGDFWKLISKRTINTPNASYDLDITDVVVDDAYIYATNFNKGDILTFNKSDLSFIETNSVGKEYNDSYDSYNDELSLTSISKYHDEQLSAVPIQNIGEPNFLISSNNTINSVPQNNSYFFFITQKDFLDVNYNVKLVYPDGDYLGRVSNESSKHSGLYGGSVGIGDFSQFGLGWKEKRHSSLLLWGGYFPTDYSFCKYDVSDILYCFDTKWNFSQGIPKDIWYNDNELIILYDKNNIVYMGKYDYYGFQISDNLEDTKQIQDLGSYDAMGWSMQNGNMWLVDSANNLYEYELVYNVSDLTYRNGSSVSLSDNDNITFKIFSDSGVKKGNYLSTSFLYDLATPPEPLLTEQTWSMSAESSGTIKTTTYESQLVVTNDDFTTSTNYTIPKSRLTDYDDRTSESFSLSSGNTLTKSDDGDNLIFTIQPTLSVGTYTFTLEYLNTITSTTTTDQATISGGGTSNTPSLRLVVVNMPSKVRQYQHLEMSFDLLFDDEYVDSDALHIYIFNAEGELKQSITSISKDGVGMYSFPLSFNNLDVGDYKLEITASKSGKVATYDYEFSVEQSLLNNDMMYDSNKRIIVFLIVGILLVMFTFMLYNSKN